MIVSHPIVLAAITSMMHGRRTSITSNSELASIMCVEGFAQLEDGTELPYTKQPSSPLDILVAHGLGSNPAAKSHRDDIATDLWNDALQFLPDGAGDGTSVFYTARGHGSSWGWDRRARAAADGAPTTKEEEDALAQPFTWPELAKDMLAVADQTSLADRSFTVLGQSMGTATALYLALLLAQEGENSRVKALILARPPLIWKARRDNAEGYRMAARTLVQQNPGSYHHLPLLGAAQTDLPEPAAAAYRKITVPVLILSHGQDDNHPLQSGKQLAAVIPQATLVVAADEGEARRRWPAIIAAWLVQQGLVLKKKKSCNS